MKVLTRREARIVKALAETMFPEGGQMLGAEGARVVEAVDDFMSRVPRQERLLMRTMFLMFEVSIAAFGPGRRLRFSKSKPEHRMAYMSAWENSDLYLRRVSFQALRSTFFLAYFGNEGVQGDIGLEDGEAAVERWRNTLRAVSKGEHDPVFHPREHARFQEISDDPR